MLSQLDVFSEITVSPTGAEIFPTKRSGGRDAKPSRSATLNATNSRVGPSSSRDAARNSPAHDSLARRTAARDSPARLFANTAREWGKRISGKGICRFADWLGAEDCGPWLNGTPAVTSRLLAKTAVSGNQKPGPRESWYVNSLMEDSMTGLRPSRRPRCPGGAYPAAECAPVPVRLFLLSFLYNKLIGQVHDRDETTSCCWDAV